MIPNAVASTGPYAGLWSHLKSMDHALERALDLSGIGSITDLDRDRFRELSDFLGTALKHKSEGGVQEYSVAQAFSQGDSGYNSAINIRPRIVALPEFSSWLSKKATDMKIRRLVETIDAYLGDGSLFPPVPAEEFTICRRLLRELLAETEAELH